MHTGAFVFFGVRRESNLATDRASGIPCLRGMAAMSVWRPFVSDTTKSKDQRNMVIFKESSRLEHFSGLVHRIYAASAEPNRSVLIAVRDHSTLGRGGNCSRKWPWNGLCDSLQLAVTQEADDQAGSTVCGSGQPCATTPKCWILPAMPARATCACSEAGTTNWCTHSGSWGRRRNGQRPM